MVSCYKTSHCCLCPRSSIYTYVNSAFCKTHQQAVKRIEKERAEIRVYCRRAGGLTRERCRRREAEGKEAIRPHARSWAWITAKDHGICWSPHVCAERTQMTVQWHTGPGFKAAPPPRFIISPSLFNCHFFYYYCCFFFFFFYGVLQINGERQENLPHMNETHTTMLMPDYDMLLYANVILPILLCHQYGVKGPFLDTEFLDHSEGANSCIFTYFSV